MCRVLRACAPILPRRVDEPRYQRTHERPRPSKTEKEKDRERDKNPARSSKFCSLVDKRFGWPPKYDGFRRGLVSVRESVSNYSTTDERIGGCD